MQKLWLKFKNENGEETRLEIERDRFTVGRHSECDLTITDGRLSREHVRFEHDQENFTVSDLNSSNGTTLNGSPLTAARELRDGDVLNLGGGVEITVEVEMSAQADHPSTSADDPASSTSGLGGAVPTTPPAAAAYPPPAAAGSDGIPTSFFIIAPLLGIFVLAVVIGAIFLFGGDKGNDIADRDNREYSSDDDDDTPETDKPTPKPVRSETPTISGQPANGSPGITPTPAAGDPGPPTGGDNSSTAKVRQTGAEFLKQVAPGDANPFLTGEQARRVEAKMKQLGRSPALSDNLNSARRNAARIKAVATAKNLNAQFLAVAALTKLGSTRGDVSQTVESIAEVYDQLESKIGSAFGDYVLLLVAAYDQGVAGDYMKLVTTVEQIGGTTDPREIRTIWYLEKAGKLTPSEFDRALTFLAIGTIAQNPKEFGVNAEALRL